MPTNCDPRCPSKLMAGRQDRCGLFSVPPLCQIGPGGCTQSEAGMQGEDTLPAPESWSTDEDFAARMSEAAGVKSVYLTVEEVTGGWPGFQVVAVKRARFHEHRVILKQFLARAGDEMTAKKGEQAGEYANVLSEFFGLEVR